MDLLDAIISIIPHPYIVQIYSFYPRNLWPPVLLEFLRETGGRKFWGQILLIVEF